MEGVRLPGDSTVERVSVMVFGRGRGRGRALLDVRAS